MDNLTHSFVGWALGRAGLDRFGTWATPTLIVAANLPDAEIPLLFGDRAMFLTYHRGITHSFCGFVVEGLALLVCGLMRWRKKPPPAFLTVFLVALVGLLSHLMLDFLNSYGVRPFLPFDATWFYGDLILFSIRGRGSSSPADFFLDQSWDAMRAGCRSSGRFSQD